MSTPQEKKPLRPTNKPQKSSLQYTGMAIQMLVPIVIGFFAGMKLDNYLQNKIPFLTLIFGLGGVATGIYLAIKDFIKK
jgi:F0F1-type ATP synthase assembly protein I